jgi:hypothetical protein
MISFRNRSYENPKAPKFFRGEVNFRIFNPGNKKIKA